MSGPQHGEAAISGNVFVWEANSTGIDRWRDGLEWNVREQDDCEVGEASNCSGLMKKTFSIPACGGVHHVVSYYTARDTPTLHGPSTRVFGSLQDIARPYLGTLSLSIFSFPPLFLVLRSSFCPSYYSYCRQCRKRSPRRIFPSELARRVCSQGTSSTQDPEKLRAGIGPLEWVGLPPWTFAKHSEVACLP